MPRPDAPGSGRPRDVSKDDDEHGVHIMRALEAHRRQVQTLELELASLKAAIGASQDSANLSKDNVGKSTNSAEISSGGEAQISQGSQSSLADVPCTSGDKAMPSNLTGTPHVKDASHRTAANGSPDVDDTSRSQGSIEPPISPLVIAETKPKRLSQQSSQLPRSATNESMKMTATGKQALQEAGKDASSQGLIMAHSMHMDSRRTWTHYWEVFVGVLIFVNAVYLGFLTEARATQNAPSETMIRLISIVFTVLFSVDLCLRMYNGGVIKFFTGGESKINIFEFVVVASMYPDALGMDQVPSISALRIVRLGRLLRIIRTLRVFTFFREFRLMIWSIAVALRALFWILWFFVILLYMAGLGMTDACLGHCSGQNNRELCEYFGSLGSSMLTIYEAILGGLLWGDVLGALAPVDFTIKALFLFIVSFVLFIIMNIIGANVFDIWQKTNASDRETSIEEEMRKRQHCITTMRNMFTEIDANGSGAISIDELEIACGDVRMEAVLSSLKIDVSDMERLFGLMDVDGTNCVDIEEFVLGCQRLKGEARTIDVVTIQREVDMLLLHTIAIKDHLMPERAAEQRASLGSKEHHGKEHHSREYHSRLSKTTASFDFNSRCRIKKVEERAMLLTELKQVCHTIQKECDLGEWTNPATGEPLDPTQVDLYQFAYFCICPHSVPDGITVCGLQPAKYSVGEIISQEGSKFRAQGVIINDSDNGDVRVRVLRGRFESSDGGRCREISVENVKRGVPNKLDVTGTISFKEAIAKAPQKPLWFCSHWWGERIFDFVLCCEEHARRRRLPPESASYWVCAYANRQYDLNDDVSSDIQNTAFWKAISVAEGVLLVLDESATPFKRIWCDFEIYQTLIGESSKMLDIVTVTSQTDHGYTEAHMLSDGPLPKENARDKSKRESTFPLNILAKGLQAKLEDGSASIEADRTRIMNYITKGSEEMDALQRANRTLNSFFARAAWPQAVKKKIVLDFDVAQPGQLSLPEVMSQDFELKTLHMSLEHMEEITDQEVVALAQGIPSNLRELNLSFEGCTNITAMGLKALASALPPNLQVLKLDFLGCHDIKDEGLEELAKAFPSSLQTIWLHFDKCEGIGTPSIKALAENVPRGAVFKGTFKHTSVDHNCASLAELKRLAKQSA